MNSKDAAYDTIKGKSCMVSNFSSQFVISQSQFVISWLLICYIILTVTSPMYDITLQIFELSKFSDIKVTE